MYIAWLCYQGCSNHDASEAEQSYCSHEASIETVFYWASLTYREVQTGKCQI